MNTTVKGNKNGSKYSSEIEMIIEIIFTLAR
jgi:hypothetical protein